jgi:catechol 2,3-dioxygenase-like lactoylglutathione lyase family enzyme
MENFIAGLVSQLDSGQIGRRQFCETVALAAVVYAAGAEAANAAPAQGFKAIAINHISYACADYRKARDFYSSVFGMTPVPQADNGREARLTFGPPPGQGGSFLIPRNGNTTSNAKAVIDHVCYTIENWDEGKIRAALKEKGLGEPTGRPGSLHVYDPFDYDVQIANATQENAFRRQA